MDRNTMTIQVYRIIKDKIVSGQLAANEKLTEQGIAKDLDVSPTPVREAFNRLVSEGFLESKPYRGVRVRSYKIEEVREAYMIRAKLQSLVYKLFLEKIDDKSISELEKVFIESLNNEVDNVFMKFHDFHRKVFEMAQCNIIQENITSINAIISVDILSRIQGEFDKKRHIMDHESLMKAIKVRDTETVESIIESMVYMTMDFVLNNMKV